MRSPQLPFELNFDEFPEFISKYPAIATYYGKDIFEFCIDKCRVIKSLGNELVKSIKDGKTEVPILLGKKEILAPPLTSNNNLIGEAFDYLLRFYIKYHNPGAISRKWVAEGSVDLLRLTLEENKLKKKRKPLRNNSLVNREMDVKKQFQIFNNIEKRYGIRKHKKQTKLINNCYQKAKKIISDAKENLVLYLEDGRINDNLIKSSLLLAKLDHIYRASNIPKSFDIDIKDIEDLKNLISLVNPELFKANKTCVLNPTFGEARVGADADLVIDDMLIDI